MKRYYKRYNHIYSLTMADIDQQNKMSPTAVLNYFQDAIGRFLAKARVSALDLLEEGATWMITEFHATLADELPSWPGLPPDDTVPQLPAIRRAVRRVQPYTARPLRLPAPSARIGTSVRHTCHNPDEHRLQRARQQQGVFPYFPVIGRLAEEEKP